MDMHIKELEARVIERAKFWDGYIGLLIHMRDAGVKSADKTNAWRVSPDEHLLRDGLQQAIDAAMRIQRSELAECFMLVGVGGERAAAYARERAQAVLGEEAIKFAHAMGWIPTNWGK